MLLIFSMLLEVNNVSETIFNLKTPTVNYSASVVIYDRKTFIVQATGQRNDEGEKRKNFLWFFTGNGPYSQNFIFFVT